MTTNELIEFHWKAIGRYDAYIATTNVKAAFLIAWNTFAIGSIGLKWSELLVPFGGMPKAGTWATICLIIAVLSALGSLWETFRVVNPFLESPRRPLKYHSLLFFRHVAEFDSDSNFHAAATNRRPDEMASDLAAQAYTLARALNFKFAALRHAIGLLLFVQLPTFILLVATYVIVALVFHV